MHYELRSFWNRYFSFNWKFGLFLILLVCIPRFVLVLSANKTGNYSFIGLIMVISLIVPFIFLNKFGRQQIGIKRGKGILTLVIAMLTGIFFSIVLYFLGTVLYGSSMENWYVYIGKSYQIPVDITPKDKKILFIIMASTGMTVSPLGEEFFFRGVVHGSFAKSLGEKKASVIDSLAFALTHLSHFGLVFIEGKWSFYFLPAIIWLGCMYLVSVLFFYMKKYYGSIWGAVVCHAGFNLGMIWCIFYLL